MADDNAKRVEVGFSGGQAIAVRISESAYERLRRAVQDGKGWHELETADGLVALDVAARLAGGSLAAFDVQQEMLDHLTREAAGRGLDNVETTVGDARALPYPDSSFDAAYLVTVLGEVPDQEAALRELRRVLKPGGRLVVGELALGDPHYVSSRALRERAARAGLEFDRRFGPVVGYFARFTRA